MIRVVNVAEKLSQIREYWSPHIVGTVNDMQVKLTKLKGEFFWHHHEREDEMFLVLRGELTMRLRDADRVIRPGEFIIVPRGVEHCPVCAEEVELMLFEPATTLNTGNVRNERTREQLKHL